MKALVVIALVMGTVFYVFGYSPPAQRCHAKGGMLGMDFACRKIQITPLG